MPKFTVLRRQDAYVDYLATVKADTPEEAAQIADSPWANLKWKKVGVSEFDACLIVTLDEDGREIEETQTGKCASPYRRLSPS